MFAKIQNLAKKNKLASYQYECFYGNRNKKIIVGIDEAGRGSLAGPVVAAAVYIKPELFAHVQVCDSKMLNAEQRATLADFLQQNVSVGIGIASVQEIEEHNILQATFLAWQRSLEDLSMSYDWLLVDGNVIPPRYQHQGIAIVRGDQICASIAAASICAKHHRDGIMHNLSRQHPQYFWHKNMGYGTLEHRMSIKQHGLSAEHRRSFTSRIVSDVAADKN